VRSLAEVGLDPDAKEAVAFAVLANETLFGRPGNVPGATGAVGPRILGKLVV
jgi:anhydro-N-acetylmuramic acid kinase